jgi:hypothetical protein
MGTSTGALRMSKLGRNEDMPWAQVEYWLSSGSKLGTYLLPSSLLSSYMCTPSVRPKGNTYYVTSSLCFLKSS